MCRTTRQRFGEFAFRNTLSANNVAYHTICLLDSTSNTQTVRHIFSTHPRTFRTEPRSPVELRYVSPAYSAWSLAGAGSSRYGVAGGYSARGETRTGVGCARSDTTDRLWLGTLVQTRGSERRETMGRVTVREKILRVREGAVSDRVDTLVVEEPLEVRVNGRPLTVTMRTPGNDFDLAVGFLAGEGVIHRADEVASIRYCAGSTTEGSNTYNIVDVALAPGVVVPEMSMERNFYTSSSCGLCGKASLEAVRTASRWTVTEDPVALTPATLSGFPEQMRAAQRVFERTGGVHAAGVFTAEGELVAVREDVGRHNAVDKLVGWALQRGRVPLRETVLMVSGRASFELVQKALMAGIPVLAAVSAPSSLAVELAADSGLTLVGFLRGSSMNVYTRQERLLT